MTKFFIFVQAVRGTTLYSVRCGRKTEQAHSRTTSVRSFYILAAVGITFPYFASYILFLQKVSGIAYHVVLSKKIKTAAASRSARTMQYTPRYQIGRTREQTKQPTFAGLVL